MARVWYDALGVILRFAQNDAEELKFGAPAGATGSIAFSEIDNPSVVSGLNTAWGEYDAVGGILRRNGLPVTLVPESPAAAQLRGKFVGGCRVSQDRSTTLATYVDIPDLQFQLEPNSHYAFSFDGAYTAAAGTTGAQLAIDGPASPSFLGVGFEIGTSATAWASAFTSAYDSGVNPTASGGATPLPFHVYGTISTGAAGGVLKLRGRSEVAGSQVTIKRGSYGLLFKVG